jgi:predicted nucleic acid-binding protein
MSRPRSYIDTSALVKRFVTELRSPDMDQFLMSNSHQCVLSSLSLTELKSVMRRKVRLGEITKAANQQAQSLVAMELAQGTWHYQTIAEPLFNYASELIDQLDTSLGALDAIHLACAKISRCSLMVSGDKQLLRAATEAGLQTLDLS